MATCGCGAYYRLPTFPSTAKIYRVGRAPPAVPDLTSICQLQLGEKTGTVLGRTPGGAVSQGAMWLLLPAMTDIRDVTAPAGPDVVEVPAGSGRVYDVLWVDEVGAGFSNEHRFAELLKRGTWPVPFPGGGGGGAAAGPVFQSELVRGSTGAGYANLLTLPVTLAASPGSFLFVVTFYSPTAGIPVVKLNGVVVGRNVATSWAIAGVGCAVNLYLQPAILAGAPTITVQFPGVQVGYAAVVGGYVTGLTGGVGVYQAANAPAPGTYLLGVPWASGGLPVLAIAFGSAGNSAPTVAPVAPFVQQGARITDTIAGLKRETWYGIAPGQLVSPVQFNSPSEGDPGWGTVGVAVW